MKLLARRRVYSAQNHAMKAWLRSPPPNLLQSEQRRLQMGPSRPNQCPASSALNVRSRGQGGVFSRGV